MRGADTFIESLFTMRRLDGFVPTSELRFMGTTLNVHSVDSWVGAGMIFLTGLGLFELGQRTPIG